MSGTQTTRRRERRALRRDLIGAAFGIGLIVVALAFAFGRQTVSLGGTEVRAVFTSANQLKPGSAVRVAGLDVGKVVKVRPFGRDRAVVTMRIDSGAPTLHADARFAIEPRLAFEGNFYVKVSPGSARLPRLRASDLVPERHTSVPVQLDQVLDVFDAPIRRAVKSTTAAFADGLGGTPSGVSGLRRAVRSLDRSADSIGRVSAAAAGRDRGDLQRAVRGMDELATAAGRDPRALAGLITNTAAVADAMADNDVALASTISSTDTLFTSGPPALRAIDAVLPRLKTFADDLRPVLDALPADLRPVNAALAQTARVSRAVELPALVSKLAPTLRALPQLQKQVGFATPYLTSVARCVSDVVVPALNQEVPDGALSIDQPVWLETLHTAASLAGASPNFDANGTTMRAGLSYGDNMLTGQVPGLGEVVGAFGNGAVGVRPRWLGVGRKPQMRPDVACEKQGVPALRSLPGVAFRGLRTIKSPAAGKTEDQRKTTERQGLESVLRSLDPTKKASSGAATSPSAGSSRTGTDATKGGSR